VLGHGEAALHMRQRDIGDRAVERLHDRRQHHRCSDEAAIDARAGRSRGTHAEGLMAADSSQRVHAGGFHGWGAAGPSCSQGNRTLVSTSTVALMPARSGWSGSPSSMTTRTGTRCTIFTQFPVEFCGGSTENSEPVPALMLSTWPWKTLSG